MFIIIASVSIFVSIVLLGICKGWALKSKNNKSSVTPLILEYKGIYLVETEAQAKGLENGNSPPISTTGSQPPLLKPQVSHNSISGGKLIVLHSGAKSEDEFPPSPSLHPQSPHRNNIGEQDSVLFLTNKKPTYIVFNMDCVIHLK